MNTFNPKEEKERIINFIRDWFNENGSKASAVIGISGGKDSTIASALCVEALGKDRVIGVLMPNGVQKDIEDALRVVKHLGIRYKVVNINNPYNEMLNALTVNSSFDFEITDALKQNLAPRLRMATLYAVAQGVPEGGRVINTCNASEDYVGYSTKFGDSAGDIGPLASYTVSEVIQIGDLLDIPKDLVHKTPSDGLCGKTDEDNLGFTYSVLDKYITTGICEDPKVKENIDRRHRLNLHKVCPLPVIERIFERALI